MSASADIALFIPRHACRLAVFLSEWLSALFLRHLSWLLNTLFRVSHFLAFGSAIFGQLSFMFIEASAKVGRILAKFLFVLINRYLIFDRSVDRWECEAISDPNGPKDGSTFYRQGCAHHR